MMPRRRRRRARGQKGIALLAVITAVAICLVIVSEFGTRTTVDELQARNHLDGMRAHFLSKSALNLAEIVLHLQHQLDAQTQGGGPMAAQFAGVQVTEFAPQLMSAFGGHADEVQNAVGFDVSDAKGLGTDIGTFDVQLTPIDGKINVNCANDTGQNKLVLAKALQSLFYSPAFDPVFQEPDATGWRRTRDQQVEAIIDYIDSDNFKSDFDQKGQLTSSTAPEDYGYEGLPDHYKAKNNTLDSVDEMKLIRGVDDRFWSLFGHEFRTQGSCKVSMRGLDDPILIVAIISAAADENDPVLRDSATMWTIANLVAKAKDYGIYFADGSSGQSGMNDFINFVKDPAAVFAGLVDPQTGQLPPGSPPLPQLPPGLHGPELKSQKLNQLVTADPIKTYKVEAFGEIERIPFLPMRRTITGVWFQDYTPQERRGQLQALTPNGAWQYIREE